jgi:hypothetical protein
MPDVFPRSRQQAPEPPSVSPDDRGPSGQVQVSTVAGGEPGRRARLFDLRMVLGGLFTVYGVVLVIRGASDNAAALQKAVGENVNLWTGTGMITFGLGCLIWMWARPLRLGVNPAPGPGDPPTPQPSVGTSESRAMAQKPRGQQIATPRLSRGQRASGAGRARNRMRRPR